MICNRCGTEMVNHFDILKLERKYECPKCSSITNAISETSASDFRSMNGIDFAKHASEEQMYVNPENCKHVENKYNPFKDLREEFEQNLLTYRNDKDTLIDILSSTMRLLIRTLEARNDYNR